jgi:tRNA (cmo5U34)-methyltransferase
MRDKLFSKKNNLTNFKFNKSVADVFDDMVKRSVPGYQSMLELIGLSVREYGKNNTNYFDLGASTGASSLALGLNNIHINNNIIAIDNSKEMTKKCKKNLQNKIDNISVICADIQDIKITNATVTVLNLTLQFIEPSKRQKLIDNIYKGLNSKGVLIIFEKIHFDNKIKQEQITKLHLDFKLANGYSKLEIGAKRKALENILITDTKKTHCNRLKKAGFKNITCCFQYLNFASFLAVK